MSKLALLLHLALLQSAAPLDPSVAVKALRRRAATCALAAPLFAPLFAPLAAAAVPPTAAAVPPTVVASPARAASPMSAQAALYREAMAGDAAARVAANEAVYEQAWGTISTMAYDPTGGLRFDGRARAAEWVARKRAAFARPATFETPAGTRVAVNELLEAIDDRWAALEPAPAERVARPRSPLDDVAVARAADAGGGLEVVAVRPGSAAERADLRVGDVVRSVAGRSAARGPAVSRAAPLRDALGGAAPPAPAALVVDRGGARLRLSLDAAAPAPDVSTVDLGDARYLRVASFDRDTPRKIAALLLEREPKARLVLDLRNNPGGTLQYAMQSAALFFDEAYASPPPASARAKPFQAPRGGAADVGRTPLCFTVNSRGEYTDHDVDEYRTDPRYPRAGGETSPRAKRDVVLLVNRGTASAAEAFAAALRDNGAATVLGERTFGKSLVQHAFPLPDGGALRLTVAELLSPRQQHLPPTTLADLRDPAARRGGLAPDALCDAAPLRPPREDACTARALGDGI